MNKPFIQSQPREPQRKKIQPKENHWFFDYLDTGEPSLAIEKISFLSPQPKRLLHRAVVLSLSWEESAREVKGRNLT